MYVNDRRRHGPGRLPLTCAGVIAAALAGLAHAVTITVDTSDDALAADGACSLREAVINANNDDQSGSTECPAGSGPDVLEFDTVTDGVPIRLKISGLDEDAAMTGDLDVSERLELLGNGTANTVIDAVGIDRVFDTTSTLNLADLTVRGGKSVQGGGALRIRGGSMALIRTVVRDSRSSVGGGIAVLSGNLFLSETVVRDNRAEGAPRLLLLGGGAVGGGGILMADVTGIGSGVSEMLIIEDSRIVANVAEFSGGGSGGGIALSPSLSTLRIERSEISGNRLDVSGGEARGGGLLITDDDVYEVTNVTLSGNQVESDILARGGGLFLANVSGSGPVILGGAAVNDTTISANTATGRDGGIASGGGFASDSGLPLEVQNTLIAGNAATSGAPDCSGGLVSNGYTLVGSNAGCSIRFDASGDVVGDVAGGGDPVDPLLTPLADHGGATFTHALVEGSPAIDAGNPNPVADGMPPACQPIDQRGEPRPADGDGDGGAVCDIGAFEGAVDAVSTVPAGGAGSGSGGGAVVWLLLAALAGVASRGVIGRDPAGATRASRPIIRCRGGKP